MRQLAGLVGGPLLAVALLVAGTPEGLSDAGWRTLAVGLLMATWWITEAVPIPATALLPVVLFPLLGVLSVRETTAPYANPLIYLFLGGFMIATGMERWGLHRRIALAVVAAVGARPRRLILGFMVAAAGLSLWISNTATALMMMPIALSVVHLARETVEPRDATRFGAALMLAVAYACSIGGIGTLIGTPTNALLAAFVLEEYGRTIGFVEWMRLGLPIAVLGIPIVHLVLTRLVFPVRFRELPGGRELIARERAQLGPWKRGERAVAFVFLCVAALWIARPALAALVPGLSDTGIAVAGALVLFAWPVDARRLEFALDWGSARRLPWGVLILFGGGLCLATATRTTGLADWLGASMAGLAGIPTPLLVLVVVAATILLTELTSNTATAAAFLPVLASMAHGLGVEPLVLLVPAAIAASCAFMLPVATPPNAIVFGTGEVTIPQMVRAGVLLGVIFSLLVTAVAFLLVPVTLGPAAG
ncbi:MAG: DASS family sodium-coupled anion symporter [Acidobacteria bacterium]|nr:MAG: DASS family sodium-coupled anion symporter [Acidobacteriota bacterium]